MRPKAYISITRPSNTIIVALSAILGYLIAVSPNGLSLQIILLLFLSAGSISSGGHVINDYVDKDIDAINKPYRPIPSGAISPKSALLYSMILFALGVLLSFLINIYTFTIAFISSVLLIVYSFVTKRLGIIGNITIATLASLTFIYGGLAACLSNRIVYPAYFAFILTLGREIVKGIEDYEGDKLHNIKTLAVTKGINYSCYISAILFIILIVTSPLPFVLGEFTIVYLIIAVCFVDIIMFASIIYLLKYKSKKIKTVRVISKGAMFLGILAFLLDSLVRWFI
ncbi:MAG: geranylgeranylglycerol-phosphate geranylgeranyltransferase [Candidatus Odinarchaeota archaeon]|nr:geranylgeranylglycerol-phosphate geranylgeranyltransferase [Candidatus Odinarchaeota archaeon]